MKVTFLVIGVCVLVFILQTAGILPQDMAFTPATFRAQPYTIVTSMFMHSGIEHLLLNMLGLFMFGTILETVIGKKEWLILYFSSGFVASIGYALVSSSPFIPAVGASGAIFGLIGGLALLRPRQVIYTMYGPVPMAGAAILWGLIEFMSMFKADNIAHSAHLFGLIGGIIVALIAMKKLSWKFMLPMLIVPPILLAAITWGMPTSIYAPQLSLPECYVLTEKSEQADIKFYMYTCGTDVSIELIRPKTQNFNLANYVEQIVYLTQSLYEDRFDSSCNATADTIDNVNNVAVVSGRVCDRYFNARGLTCKGSDIIAVQITKELAQPLNISCN